MDGGGDSVTRRTARETLVYIAFPTVAFFLAFGFDWRVLLVAPCMWFIGFAHGARSAPGTSARTRTTEGVAVDG